LRLVILVLAGAEALLFLLVLFNGVFSTSDPATRGLDSAVAIAATAVFALSGLPALILALKGRWLKTGLLLACLPVLALLAGIVWWVSES
jgi:hypothetical protein